jgi:hypothetical protein
MIEICNLRDMHVKEPWDFRVDRKTPLGNPFIMKNESMRDWSCDSYDNNFEDLIKQDSAKAYLCKLVLAYQRYGRLRLFCWCAPKRCHGETVRRYILECVDEAK